MNAIEIQRNKITSTLNKVVMELVAMKHTFIHDTLLAITCLLPIICSKLKDVNLHECEDQSKNSLEAKSEPCVDSYSGVEYPPRVISASRESSASPSPWSIVSAPGYPTTLQHRRSTTLLTGYLRYMEAQIVQTTLIIFLLRQSNFICCKLYQTSVY